MRSAGWVVPLYACGAEYYPAAYGSPMPVAPLPFRLACSPATAGGQSGRWHVACGLTPGCDVWDTRHIRRGPCRMFPQRFPS